MAILLVVSVAAVLIYGAYVMFEVDNKLAMKVTAITYETTVGKYAYRLIQDQRGVTVKRIPADDMRLWSHGVISQMYDEDAGFVQTILVKKMKHFATLEEAQQAIKDAK